MRESVLRALSRDRESHYAARTIRVKNYLRALSRELLDRKRLQPAPTRAMSGETGCLKPGENYFPVRSADGAVAAVPGSTSAAVWLAARSASTAMAAAASSAFS